MSAAVRPSAASALLRVLSWSCCETLPGATEVAAAVDPESSCELDALCALAFDVLDPEFADPPDGNVSAVFGALNKPAACAVESADSVTGEGVNESWGNAEAAACGDPAFLLADLCVCCVDGWPSNPSFRFTTLVTDTIHLLAAVLTVDAKLRAAKLNRQ